MTKDQESFFAMLLKTNNFYLKNKASLAAISVVTSFYNILDDNIIQLITADTGSRTDLSGITINKAVKRQEVETLALKISNALGTYSVVNEDIILGKKVALSSSKWYSFSEEELVTQATIIYNLATPLSTAIEPYGATASDVTAIGTALKTFTISISDPSLAIDQRKKDNLTVVDIIDKTRILFAEKLDIVMRSFEVNNPSLYSLYQSARAIDVNGAIQEPTVVKTIMPNTTTTVHTATVYETRTFYTLQNMGTEPVSFSLSSTDNQEGATAITLNGGETRSRLAQNLAPAGVYLVVKNAGVGQADVKVWVE
jgi:hypothetical protein